MNNTAITIVSVRKVFSHADRLLIQNPRVAMPSDHHHLRIVEDIRINLWGDASATTTDTGVRGFTGRPAQNLRVSVACEQSLHSTTVVFPWFHWLFRNGTFRAIA
jgi:hypothetical protein